MGGSCSCLRSRSERAVPASSTTSSLVTEPRQGQSSTPTIDQIVTESLEGQTLGTIELQIEASKCHWSQLADFELDGDDFGLVAEVSNVEVYRALQSHPKWGTFFQTFGEDGIGELVMGQQFAEGGQAKLYDVEIIWNEPLMNEDDLRLRHKWILKVFKKGTFLRQLQSQWPRGMLQDYVDRTEWARRGNLPKVRSRSDVYHGILLEDGRFAFLMVKEHEDLRHQIDNLMLIAGKDRCPYSKIEVEATMYRVAVGMEWLHSHGIIHRDLKASNVLCTKFEHGWTYCVADFECSVGVIGTGFFRAPEILQACKDHTISSKPELFTKEADVYSYGMVCYEILTGRLPFEKHMQGDFDHVLVGERPKVPEYVDWWIRVLLRMCWRANPVDRPSFGEILEILFNNSETCRELHAYSKKYEAELAMGINNASVRWVALGSDYKKAH